MSGLTIFLILLSPPQDTKKAEPAGDDVKRAAAVERLLAQPQVVPRRVGQAPVNQNIVITRKAQAMKRITLELREVEREADDADVPQQPFGMGKPINIGELALSKDNFDRWVFGDELSMEARRIRLDGLLSDKIFTCDKDRPIEPDQLRKLRLAGNGDIKRFLDRVEMGRTQFEMARQDYTAGRQALARVEPLQSEYQTGPFGPNSVFEKTLRKLRGEEKAATPEAK